MLATSQVAPTSDGTAARIEPRIEINTTAVRGAAQLANPSDKRVTVPAGTVVDHMQPIVSSRTSRVSSPESSPVDSVPSPKIQEELSGSSENSFSNTKSTLSNNNNCSM